MKTLFLMTAVLISSSAFAQVQPDPTNKDLAYQMCSAMPFKKTDCAQLVAATTFFNRDALSACKSSFEDDTISCMSAIKNADFQSELVNACKKMPFHKTNCMSMIANQVADIPAINACNSPFEDDEIACLQKVIRPYASVEPAPLPPTVVCEKAVVMKSLEKAIKSAKSFKMMDTVKSIMFVTSYLNRCMK